MNEPKTATSRLNDAISAKSPGAMIIWRTVRSGTGKSERGWWFYSVGGRSHWIAANEAEALAWIETQ